MNQYNVTEENINDVRLTMSANDQRDALEPGCWTAGIYYQPAGQRGQITRWPNGRGAICFGGDSHWGDWVDVSQYGDPSTVADILALESGEYYDDNGQQCCEHGYPLDDCEYCVS